MKDSIEALSQFSQQKQQQFTANTYTAQQWLDAAPAAAEVRARLAQLDSPQSEWDGAWPVTDAPLNARFQVSAGPDHGVTLIAVDGSQIFPDHHAAILYYLIQVGGLIFHYDGSTPIPEKDATLYFRDDEIYDRQGYTISTTDVNRERLVKEMLWLAGLAEREQQTSPATCFALTDGPLLWSYPERGSETSSAFHRYQEALTRLRQSQSVAVGYVDRPGGRALLDLLWAIQIPPEKLREQLHATPLQFMSDHRVMMNFLKPGERSAWFKRLSPTNRLHAGKSNEIWFCYLNVGTSHHPAIARVELPDWAAQQDHLMQSLHAALLHQSRVLNGYPYALARAHEEALVTTRDKATLEDVIQRHLMENGVIVRPSDKAIQKSYLGKR
ncbi:MAG: DNA double-strand break repair nuclease NurA [Anaerolineae bacterium]|nr:DNA double-strand break repair nuclease NurA [Anaerolineae bacterium]